MKRGFARSVCLSFLVLAWPGIALAQSSFKQIKDQYRASDLRVLDRSGQLLERVRTDFHSRRGDWVALDDVSVSLQRAVILSEDRHFYSHAGVDWPAIAAAAWSNLLGEGRRGASTLSMQLMGLVDADLRRASAGRSVVQKIDQALAARRLEEYWSKAQILEAYLNLAAFRGELVGIDALSRVLFQKHPSGLNAREAALAAVLLRGPNVRQPVLVQRTCTLLVDMGLPQECQGLSDFISSTSRRTSAQWADSPSLAPHYSRLAVQEERSGGDEQDLSVRTSLDAGLQRYALQSVQRNLNELGMANMRDAAVVVQDNRTGQVLAYVGSSGDLSSAARVDHARALRQAGSTLKPFLYAQAIEQERLTTVSLLNDGPLGLATGNGLYIPQNYDKRFSGWVSVRTALASSLNIPAVRALVMVTPDVFAQRLVGLGLPLDRSGDFYGYSLALGSADVTLLSLTNAYRAFANAGRYSPPQFLLGVDTVKTKAVMPADTSWIIGDILSDRQARARTFGLDSALSTPFWTAVKTGTSKDMRDNWCIGWSEHYTVGVWVGNSGGASMHDVSGVSGAGPIWHELMSRLHQSTPSHKPLEPAALHHSQVKFQDDLEPTRYDYFVGDTVMTHVQLIQGGAQSPQGPPKIAAPVSRTILALDPDIPPDHQRMWLRAESVNADQASKLSWRVGARTLGHGAELAWQPWPGKHRIELLDSDERVLDTVHVEVRAYTPRQ